MCYMGSRYSNVNLAFLREKGAAHCKVQGPSAVSCAETAQPIDLPFGLWAHSGGSNEAEVQSYLPDGDKVHNFNRIRQVVPMYPTTLP